MPPLITPLYEDPNILVVHKPAGLVCHPTKGDQYSSLASRLRLYLNVPEQSIHLVNRLDRETSGVLLAAKNSDAARELRQLFASRDVRKYYMAIVHGQPPPDVQKIDSAIGPDPHSPISIKDCVRPDGAPAATLYQVRHAFERDGEKFSLLEVELLTGRKHQIRIHLQHAGYPIVGDKMYGLDPDCYLAFVERRLTDRQQRLLRLENQALHSMRIEFTWRNRQWTFRSSPEPEFLSFLNENGRSTAMKLAGAPCAEVSDSVPSSSSSSS